MYLQDFTKDAMPYNMFDHYGSMVFPVCSAVGYFLRRRPTTWIRSQIRYRSLILSTSLTTRIAIFATPKFAILSRFLHSLTNFIFSWQTLWHVDLASICWIFSPFPPDTFHPAHRFIRRVAVISKFHPLWIRIEYRLNSNTTPAQPKWDQIVRTDYSILP